MFIDIVLFGMAIFTYATLANQSLVQALKKDRAPWQFSNWSYLIDAAIILALWLPLEFGIVKYFLATSSVAASPAMIHFLALAPILITIGVATNFTAFIGFAKINLWSLLIPFIALYAIAIPEELLFRGMIQHITEHFFGKKIGLALAAIIFGLAHANSGDFQIG